MGTFSAVSDGSLSTIQILHQDKEPSPVLYSIPTLIKDRDKKNKIEKLRKKIENKKILNQETIDGMGNLLLQKAIILQKKDTENTV